MDKLTHYINKYGKYKKKYQIEKQYNIHKGGEEKNMNIDYCIKSFDIDKKYAYNCIKEIFELFPEEIIKHDTQQLYAITKQQLEHDVKVIKCKNFNIYNNKYIDESRIEHYIYDMITVNKITITNISNKDIKKIIMEMRSDFNTEVKYVNLIDNVYNKISSHGDETQREAYSTLNKIELIRECIKKAILNNNNLSDVKIYIDDLYKGTHIEIIDKLSDMIEMYYSNYMSLNNMQDHIMSQYTNYMTIYTHVINCLIFFMDNESNEIDYKDKIKDKIKDKMDELIKYMKLDKMYDIYKEKEQQTGNIRDLYMYLLENIENRRLHNKSLIKEELYCIYLYNTGQI